MSGWERIAEWLATVLVAGLAWVSGLAATDMPRELGFAIESGAVADDGPALMLTWAQQDDEPAIEPLDEETGDSAEPLDAETGDTATVTADAADIETLDEGAPPPAELPPATDAELQDTATVAATDEDIELLDQGAPPAPAAAVPVAAAPVDTTYVAPDQPALTYPAAAAPVATGPVLPPGFGTGTVHVSAGREGFPAGLADCHVGAVTGRAYVGIDCGEGDASFVGHAPTFEDFPFVVEGEFPFDDRDVALDDPGFPFDSSDADDGFTFVTAAEDVEDDPEVLVATARPGNDAARGAEAAPQVETSGTSTVEYAQRARDRDPRVRLEERGEKKDRKSRKSAQGGNADVQAAAADADDGSRDNDKKKNRNKKGKGRVESEDRDDERSRADKKDKKDKKKKDRKDKKKRERQRRADR